MISPTRCFSMISPILPSLLQYNLVGILGSRLRVLSVLCQSYNKRNNWLATPFLGYEVRDGDCQPSSYRSVRAKQVKP